MNDKSNESEKSFKSCEDSENDVESEKSFRSCSDKDSVDDDIKIGTCRENASDEDISSWDENDENNGWIYEDNDMKEVGKCSETKVMSEDAIKDLETIMEKHLTVEAQSYDLNCDSEIISQKEKFVKNDPSVIPRSGKFFMHDNRNEETEKTEDKKVVKKKPDKEWAHDLFNVDKQKPRSNEEIIAKYGYNIRVGDVTEAEDKDKQLENSQKKHRNDKSKRGHFRTNGETQNLTTATENKDDNNLTTSTMPLSTNNNINNNIRRKKRPKDTKKSTTNSLVMSEEQTDEVSNIQITVDKRGNRFTKKANAYNNGNNRRKKYNHDQDQIKQQQKQQPEWDVDSTDIYAVIEEMPPLTKEEMEKIKQNANEVNGKSKRESPMPPVTNDKNNKGNKVQYNQNNFKWMDKKQKRRQRNRRGNEECEDDYYFYDNNYDCNQWRGEWADDFYYYNYNDNGQWRNRRASGDFTGKNYYYYGDNYMSGKYRDEYVWVSSKNRGAVSHRDFDENPRRREGRRYNNYFQQSEQKFPRHHRDFYEWEDGRHNKRRDEGYKKTGPLRYSYHQHKNNTTNNNNGYRGKKEEEGAVGFSYGGNKPKRYSQMRRKEEIEELRDKEEKIEQKDDKKENEETVKISSYNRIPPLPAPMAMGLSGYCGNNAAAAAAAAAAAGLPNLNANLMLSSPIYIQPPTATPHLFFPSPTQHHPIYPGTHQQHTALALSTPQIQTANQSQPNQQPQSNSGLTIRPVVGRS